MTGPARAGAVVYAKDVARLTAFYRELLQASTLHEDAEHAVLQSADIQLVIHAIPPHIAGTFEIASPPEPRETQAIKLFFTVPSIDWARTTVDVAGGGLLGASWQGQGFSACNAMDPEGNVVQVREALGGA